MIYYEIIVTFYVDELEDSSSAIPYTSEFSHDRTVTAAEYKPILVIAGVTLTIFAPLFM